MRRTSIVIGTLAAAVGLWLGLTAPTVSPVTPPLPAVVAPAPAAR